MSDLVDRTETTLYGPDGEKVVPTTLLSTEDAELLRKYKKFLAKQGLREALYCQSCWNGEREDGCKAFVTDGQIGILCRCRNRFFHGMTY